MNKIKALLFILFCVSTSLQAQNITGMLVDAHSKEPLPFVNVVLLKAMDSTFVKGVISDRDGSFNIELPQTDKYLLRINYLGYESKIIDVQQNNVDAIPLFPNSQLLNEAVVATTAKIFKIEDGGMSTQIQDTWLQNLGSANEVLTQLPLVTQDGENFTVFGKGTPLIYVNNRLVRDITELQEINSADIKKITVITSPGAEYDATVQSVIKIETVRPQGEGLSGTVTGNLHVDRKFSHSELVNLNYRKKNLDIFGMLRFSQAKDKSYMILEQNTHFNDQILTILNSEHDYHRMNIRSNLGFNYLFGKDNSVGAKYELTSTPLAQGELISNMDVYRNNQFIETFASDWNTNDKRNAHYVNSYLYLGQFKWLTVKLDMDFRIGNNSGSQNVLNYYDHITESIATNSNQNHYLYATKLVMATPIKAGKLNYGGEYAYTYNHQDFKVNDEGEAQNLSPNNNTAKQNLLAAFASFSYPFGNFSADLGLRYENTDFNYFANGIKEEDQSKIYHNLFPNVGISYNNVKHSIAATLSYRSTIYRPSYYQLRNSMQYDSPYTYEAGNPYLKPMIANTLSGLFMWKDITLMVNFDMYENSILDIPEQYSDETVLLRPVNLDKSQNLTAAISYSPTFFKIWNPNLQIGVSKNFLKYNEITFNTPLFFMSMGNNITLPKNWQIGADVSYVSSGNYSIFYVHGVFKMGFHVSKSFFKNKLRINLRGSDIFNTEREKVDTQINNIAIRLNKNSNTQGVHLSVTYRFNATQNKYRGEAASDEQNRL
ncbi:MAG: TonB-dependent receptor [Bacteroidetes bacterium]|nr:TonB-dependent receptor [Bacteroidota bacterium]MCL2301739.1 TonB-dependent receptor [Lentimicrobiaceae bacterium]